MRLKEVLGLLADFMSCDREVFCMKTKIRTGKSPFDIVTTITRNYELKNSDMRLKEEINAFLSGCGSSARIESLREEEHWLGIKFVIPSLLPHIMTDDNDYVDECFVEKNHGSYNDVYKEIEEENGDDVSALRQERVQSVLDRLLIILKGNNSNDVKVCIKPIKGSTMMKNPPQESSITLSDNKRPVVIRVARVLSKHESAREVEDAFKTKHVSSSEEVIEKLAAAEMSHQLLLHLDQCLHLRVNEEQRSPIVFVLYNYARMFKLCQDYQNKLQIGAYSTNCSDPRCIDFSSLLSESLEWQLAFCGVFALPWVLERVTNDVLKCKGLNLMPIFQWAIDVSHCFSRYYRHTRILRNIDNDVKEHEEGERLMLKIQARMILVERLLKTMQSFDGDGLCDHGELIALVSKMLLSSLGRCCAHHLQTKGLRTWRLPSSTSSIMQPLRLSVNPSKIYYDGLRCLSNSSLTVWQDVKLTPQAPKPALALGIAGLIPFITPPILMVQQSSFSSGLSQLQLLYAASILSFLGGVRWGSLLNGNNNSTWLQYGWSVTPSLIAWLALLLPSSLSSHVGVVMGLILALYFDLVHYGYPGWFKGLRFVLSSVAILALWTVIVCQLVLDEKK